MFSSRDAFENDFCPVRDELLGEMYRASVVPAKAGTHTHRIQLFWKGVCHIALLIDHAVWVPAFAGTTCGWITPAHPSQTASAPCCTRHRRACRCGRPRAGPGKSRSE